MNQQGKNLGVCLIQLNVTDNKTQNLNNAVRLIREAYQQHKPTLVILPESFYIQHGNRQMYQQYAENFQNGDAYKTMQNLAKELKIYLIAGSMVEKDNNNLYNTMCAFDQNGNLLNKYRQMHLGQWNFNNDCSLNENEYFKFGNNLACVNIDGWKIGMGICADLFYGEMANLYRQNGCHMLVYVNAFHQTVGQDRLELLTRARAADNQLYVVNCSQARNHDNIQGSNHFNNNNLFGHSMFADAKGHVMNRADNREQYIFQTLYMNDIDYHRHNIRIIDNQRTDVYETVYKNQNHKF